MKYLIPIIITVVAFLVASLRLGANEGANDFIEPVLAAADKGNATAQAMVGTMYYYGYGLSQDYKKALFWYKLAAEFGEVSQALRHSTVRLARQQLYQGQGEQPRQCPRAMAVVVFAFAVLCHETPEPVSTAAFELSI